MQYHVNILKAVVHATAFFVNFNLNGMNAAIKKDFLIRTIANEKILIGSGEQINFSKMLMLNDTAVFVIEELQKHSAPVACETLAGRLSDVYDVDYADALADVEELVRHLETLGVVVVS